MFSIKLIRVIPNPLLNHLKITSAFSSTNSLNSKHGRSQIWKNRTKKIQAAETDSGMNDFVPLSHLFTPVKLEEVTEDEDYGAHMTEPLDLGKVKQVVDSFLNDDMIYELSIEYGMDEHIFRNVQTSFKDLCLNQRLPAELHLRLYDITNGNVHHHELNSFFHEHACKLYPHLKCMDDLYKISDITDPTKWYPSARSMKRKIIFHAGPTNSGKTYHAMERLINSKSGIYCSPLKLLAVEVFQKCNDKGTPCDLVTGEEERYAISKEEPTDHVACTVEMTDIINECEVAVIDEIQMIKDVQRGWAWTRALLGIPAKEVHVCGESAAVEVVKNLVEICGDEFEVNDYKRLTKLKIEDKALVSLDNAMPGDCIVCFSKKHLHTVAKQLDKHFKDIALIYGALPPGAKIAQCNKFNDPSSKCKIMVATDAVGMGLNLSIKRIIFYSVSKPTLQSDGNINHDNLSVSQALQVGGRAGRYNTAYETGFVTTLLPEDLNTLKRLMRSQPPMIERAGLQPTADQIELFAYYLPEYKMSVLVDIFCRLCKMDSSYYFLCDTRTFKALADLIEHLDLDLRTQYVYACAPISERHIYTCSIFTKFAKKHSEGSEISAEWLCKELEYSSKPPRNVEDLVKLENIFDIMDLYLWFSNRYPEIYSDSETVRDIQKETDRLISDTVNNIHRILKDNSHSQKSLTNNKTLNSNERNLLRIKSLKKRIMEHQMNNNYNKKRKH